MNDLHERIEAELRRRLEVARAATPGPWTTSGPDTIAQWTIYDRQWSVASATAYDHNESMSNKPDATGPGYIDPDANAAHIALHDPADSIRRYEAGLAAVADHASMPTLAGDPVCTAGGRFAPWPCEHMEIRRLAASLGIEAPDA